ncbi:MAG TPA: hypothetical protein VMS45_07985, partial [Gemmatimonadaceae bacterium]|nr:hypothetical protein [Gemmatimonadaceae bacterium]
SRTGCVATPVLIDGEWKLPPRSNIKLPRFSTLVDLDMDTVIQDDVLLIDEFAREWVADVWPNQAIRADANGACEIGQPTFGAALAAWRARTGA